MGAEGGISIGASSFMVVPTSEWRAPTHLVVQGGPEIVAIIGRLLHASRNTAEGVQQVFTKEERPESRLLPEMILGVIQSLPNNSWLKIDEEESLIILVRFPNDTTDAGYFRITPTLGIHTDAHDRTLYMSWRGNCRPDKLSRQCCHDLVEAKFLTL